MRLVTNSAAHARTLDLSGTLSRRADSNCRPAVYEWHAKEALRRVFPSDPAVPT
jgi:hypothetical protein